MATYDTDLNTISTNDASTGWGEMVNPQGGGGAPSLDNESFIQGTGSVAQNTATATDQGAGINLLLSDVGVTLSESTWTAGEVMWVWLNFAAASNLYEWDASGGTGSGGWLCGFQDNRQNNNSRWDGWRTLGDNFGTYPYGGWQCAVFDPSDSTTADQNGAGGSAAGTWNYFISVPNLRNAISKGDPHVVDAIRYGRGRLTITGTGSSFAEIAEYNDYDDAANTPPGTSSTSIDSGRHKLGIFSERQGSYIWQGLLQFGSAASSITFTDSNENIRKLDTPRTYADFDRVEIRNTASEVNWTTVNWQGATDTIETVFTNFPRSYGRFEMIDDANVNLTGCTFTDLGTFIFQSNATVDACTFRRDFEITQGAATFTDCLFDGSQAANTIVVATPADVNNITGCEFIKPATDNHAVNFGTVNPGSPVTINWNNNTLEGYTAGSTGTFTGTAADANAAISITNNGANVTIDVLGTATVPSVENTGTGNVIVQSSVTNTVTVTDTSGAAVSGALVIIIVTGTNTELTSGLTNGSGVFTFGSAASIPIAVRVRKSTSGTTRYVPIDTPSNTGSGADVFITLTEDLIASA